jgi:hypothetical protein
MIESPYAYTSEDKGSGKKRSGQEAFPSRPEDLVQRSLEIIIRFWDPWGAKNEQLKEESLV